MESLVNQDKEMFQIVGEKEMVKRKLRTSEIRIKPPI